MEPTMKLVVRGGDKAEYPLDAEVVRLGRERARTVPVNDPQVSRQHAEITCAADGPQTRAWIIRDLGSSNGTYVNEVLLTGSRRLNKGDRIRVGNTVLTFSEMESGRGFRNGVAVLIAISTLVGALVAWRSSLAADNAAAARVTGTTVLIGLTRHQTEITSNLYQNLDAFASYLWHLAMTEQIDEDLVVTEEADSQQEALESDRLRHANMALAALDLLNLDYLRRTDDATAGPTFERERFYETNLAEVASQEDLDYLAHFGESDREATIALRFTLSAVLLGLSVFFYTGATLATSRLKYLWVAIGAFMAGAGGLVAALIEVGRRIG